MARSRATIHVTALNDADFRDLPALAKYLYWVLLAQSKLTIAGCLDLKTARWAEISPDTSPELIDSLLDVLEERRYVAIDRETDELVVRTFVKHDVAGNKNSQRGVWGAWVGIESPYLRRVVVANIPDAMWDNPDVQAPDEAVRMREEPLLERPSRRPSEHPIVERAMERLIERATELPIPSPVPPPTPTTDADAVLDEASRLLASAEVERRGDVSNPDGYIRSRLRDIRRQHEQRWRSVLAEFPGATAHELVTPKAQPVAPVASPLDSTAAAALARYEREEARRRSEPCEPCDGAGQVETDGRWDRCGACNGTGFELAVAG